MDLDLTGKRALVCGASEGIGRATAFELATLGASVTVLARREAALREVVDGLPRGTSQSHGFIVADMADGDGLREEAAALASESPVHILVNNTGGPPAGRAIEAGIDAFLDAYRCLLYTSPSPRD